MLLQQLNRFARLCLGSVLLQGATERHKKKSIEVRRVTAHLQRTYFNNIRKEVVLFCGAPTVIHGSDIHKSDTVAS
jgi:hypothetical protein